MLDPQMWKKIAQMNERWKSKALDLPDIEHIRDGLAQLGRFKRVEKLAPEQLKDYFGGCAMIAVDGSTYTYGGNHPYRISFLRAMAKCTGSEGESHNVMESHVVSPLNDEDDIAFKEYMVVRSEKKAGLTEEMAFEEWKNKQLARLEIEVAITAVRKHKPKLLLFDGGFLRYEGADSALWETYKQAAAEAGTTTVGVIEEVGTNELAKKLGEASGLSLGMMRDRELLYGIFETGEWFEFPHAVSLKSSFYTCFTRLSHDPQSIGLDLFMEGLHSLDSILNVLYTFTPLRTRGIPLPIDLVDEKVRIRKEEVDLLIKKFVDPGLHERLLNPMRTRRDF